MLLHRPAIGIYLWDLVSRSQLSVMFHSVPRRPICEIGVNTMRLQSSRSLGCTVEEGMEKLQRFPMLGRKVGLLLSWLQRAGVGSNRASGQKKKKGLLSIFADHCGFVTGQRLRRACQVGELYSNLYSERTRWTLVGNIWRRFQNNHAPTGKLVAALAGVFLWDIEKIKDEEIRRWGLLALHQWTVGMERYYPILGN